MKRSLSFILILAIVLTACFQFTGTVNAAATELKALPQVGAVVEGFKVVEIGDMELVNAKTALFEHVKTGAKLLYIQNSDTNRTFQIAYKTPATDNTGVNHIIEHSVVSGSQKYPLTNILFTVAAQTYCSFINAFTSQTMTSYPVSSLSEDQLLKLTDMYMDCTLNPLVYTDKNIFNREATRYELSTTSASLQITGTVYNEMKGNMSNLAMAARENLRKTLFPNSTQSNNSGGNPDDIKSLTYEGLLKTHTTYYQPSNSLMILYGNLDYEKFLKLINDNYLSKYDKKEVSIDAGITKPFSKKVNGEYKYPVSAATNTKNAAQIDYAFALSNLSQEEIVALGMLSDYLNLDTSPLKKTFSDKGIGGSLSVSFDPSSSQAVFNFSVQNVDASKKAEIQAIVDNSLSNIIKSGIDKDAVDAIISLYILSNSNATEASNVGPTLASQISMMWANFGDLHFLDNFMKNVEDIRSKVKSNYFEALVQKLFIDNNHAALISTSPEAGLAEKEASEEATALSSIKSKLTPAQLEEMVKATKDFATWNTKTDNPEVIKKLQAVTASSLPEEVKNYGVEEKLLNGVKSLTAKANVGETGETCVLLNTSAVPAQQLMFLELYSELLGKVSTKNYTQQKLSTEMTRYLNGSRVYATTLSQKGSKTFTPYLAMSWIGLNEDYEKSISLLKEILFNSDFTKTDEIAAYVKQQISLMKYSFENNPINLQIVRNVSTNDAETNYSNYISGLDYYSFLQQVDSLLSSNAGAITEQLNKISKLVLSKDNIITAYAGNKAGIDIYEKNIGNLVNALNSNKLQSQDYSILPVPATSEAIVVNSTVQYNMMSANYEKMGTQFSGKFLPIGKYIYDSYLTPQIRFIGGAYDSIYSFTEKGFFVMSYRDPKIKETYEVFAKLPDFLKNTTVTQEQLNSYIVNTYSAYATPTGELTGAMTQIIEYMQGKTTDDKLKLLKEIKSTTVEDIKNMGTTMDLFIKNASISTVGSQQKISESKDLFKSIINIAASQQQQANATITRGEFISALFQNAPNASELAIKSGIIMGDGKGNYNLDQKLTKQDMIVILSRVIDFSKLKKVNKDITITDIGLVSSWARNTVNLAVETGVITLDEKGSFNPKAEITMEYLQQVFTNINSIAAGQ